MPYQGHGLTSIVFFIPHENGTQLPITNVRMALWRAISKAIQKMRKLIGRDIIESREHDALTRLCHLNHQALKIGRVRLALTTLHKCIEPAFVFTN